MSTSVLVSTFRPFPTLNITVSVDATFSELYDLLTERYPDLPLNGSETLDLVLSPHSGPIPSADTPLSTLLEDSDANLVTLRLLPRLRGGKGGFGSQLRAAGGRMSSQKTSNNDSCRDLSGRRLSTIKEAKRLADYIESEPARKQAQKEAQRAKLEALEKKLGINKDGSSDGLPARKHRLDDTEYVEESKEIVDNVKSAVTAGLLKKRKKVKTSPSPPVASASTSAGSTSTADKVISATASATTAVTTAISETADKVLTAPETAPVAVVMSAVAGIAAA